MIFAFGRAFMGKKSHAWLPETCSRTPRVVTKQVHPVALQKIQGGQDSHLSAQKLLPQLEGALGGILLTNLDAPDMGHTYMFGLAGQELEGVQGGPHVAV